MKSILFTMLILIGFCSVSQAKTINRPVRPVYSDTTVLPQILGLPLSTYIGKPVDSLLSVLPSNYTDRGFMPYGAGYTKGVFQSYSTSNTNNCFVEIYIDTFSFLPIPNLTPTSTWIMALTKQETIAYIRVVKNNTACVYGCNNQNYYH
jgi:hypothetical protein